MAIDSVNQIVATIQAEMAARMNTAGVKTPAAKAKQANRPKADSMAEQQQRMSQLISQRVKSLDPDDPKRGKKAFRIFLESVLLAEFGEGLINDPNFYQMVDDVQNVMEQDSRIADVIAKAVGSLLNSTSDSS